MFIKKVLLILDVDGVLTDGKKYYDKTGTCVLKKFNDRDFTAIKKIKSVGNEVVFLSGDLNINENIAINRKIDFYCNKRNGNLIEKSEFVEIFKQKYNVDESQMIYVGDDIFDIKIMQKVNYSFCPSDSPTEVKQTAKFILKSKSGENCLTELYDILTRLSIIEPYNYEKLLELDKNERF